MMNSKKNFDFTKNIAFLFVLFVIIIGTCFAETSNNTISDSQSKSLGISNRTICETRDCVLTAASILQSIDQSVDPCDNFYQFSCGNFIKRTNIPKGRASVTRFTLLDDSLQEQIRTIIESEIKDDDEKPFRLAKAYYRVCLNQTKNNALSSDQLLQLLSTFGGWPVLLGEKWNSSNFDWINATLKMAEIGFPPAYIAAVRSVVDNNNSSRYMMALDEPDFGLDFQYLLEGLDNKFVRGYYDLMVDVAQILGADRKAAETELMEALKFEIALSKIILAGEKRRDPTILDNPIKASEFSKKYPGIPWVQIINDVLVNHTRIDDDEYINVIEPEFMVQLVELLNATDSRTLANYISWRLVKDVMETLNDTIYNRYVSFGNLLYSTDGQSSRDVRCISEVSDTLAIAVSYMYVKEFFDEESKKKIEELTTDLRESFREILENSEWMDNSTKTEALKKLKYIREYIAYPEQLVNQTVIDKFYKGLDVDLSKSFFDNKLMFRKHYSDVTYRNFRNPDINEIYMVAHGQAAKINAFFTTSDNSIEFPAGILQDVFFRSGNPKYANYGAIGQVIGHEITHGFDDVGKEYDHLGQLSNWWQESTKESYKKRVECVVEQFNNYNAEEINGTLNGEVTQGENIADLGGIKEAYLAYEAWERKHGVEPSLPGLFYTSRQLFWISAANIWCEKMIPERMKELIMTNTHSPARFRVLSQVTNFPAFAKDFNCPAGSKMNPGKRCAVWRSFD